MISECTVPVTGLMIVRVRLCRWSRWGTESFREKSLRMLQGGRDAFVVKHGSVAAELSDVMRLLRPAFQGVGLDACNGSRGRVIFNLVVVLTLLGTWSKAFP